MTPHRRIPIGVAIAWALFAIAALAGHLAERIVDVEAHPWLPHAIVKTTLVGLAVAAMALAGGPAAGWGFTRPRQPRWRRTILRGGLLGAFAAILIVLTPARGMPFMREIGLAGVVLWIWIYSSVTEEIFVRGWFQSLVAGPPAEAGPAGRPGRVAISPAVLASGLLFGSLHLGLITLGADPWTVCIIVLATTVLGLFAALDRERTGSLLPPIVTHISFNVGGLVGGIVGTIIRVAATGEPPTPP